MDYEGGLHGTREKIAFRELAVDQKSFLRSASGYSQKFASRMFTTLQ